MWTHIKETPKSSYLGLCDGNSPVTGEFPAQRASNAEKASIWWLHHGRQSWWRHQMETVSALLAICAGNSPVPVNSPHKGQWRGTLMFTLICARINGWVNNCEAGDLRRNRAHYDVIVMIMCKYYGIYLINWPAIQQFTVNTITTHRPKSTKILFQSFGILQKLNF